MTIISDKTLSSDFMVTSNLQRIYTPLRSILIFSATLLLAIWCIRNSIALRNFLLFFGSFLSIPIITAHASSRVPSGVNSYKKISVDRCAFIPILLLALLFLWVIVHFLFLSREYSLQLQELKGTWLRGVLALIFGSAIGILMRNNEKAPNFLWLGIYSSFCYLFIDYLYALQNAPSLFIANYYFSSPFGNKINTVLMGGLFIAAICGTSAYTIANNKKIPWYIYLLWISGVSLILFSYTQIIDTRNGIGLAIILLLFWAAYLTIKILGRNLHAKTFGALLITVLLACYFIYSHLSLNKGWNHFFDDIEVGMQVDKYPNWQNIHKFGYPITKNGEAVYPNNYERAAWAAVGAHTLLKNPLGFGLLEHSLGYQIQEQYPESKVMSSHSAWIDFGLAFGIPGLILILGSLFTILTLAIKSKSPHALPVIWLTMSLLLTFTIAETSSKHSIEVLLFFIGFMTFVISKAPKK